MAESEKKKEEALEKRLKEIESKLAESVPKKEADELRRRISELEKELERAMHTIRDLQAPTRDMGSRLEDVVGSSGKVKLEYGGYHITVENPDRFPWAEVMTILCDSQYAIWVEKRDEHLVVKSKPPGD